jgi:hypothetical protein
MRPATLAHPTIFFQAILCAEPHHSHIYYSEVYIEYYLPMFNIIYSLLYSLPISPTFAHYTPLSPDRIQYSFILCRTSFKFISILRSPAFLLKKKGGKSIFKSLKEIMNRDLLKQNLPILGLVVPTSQCGLYRDKLDGYAIFLYAA